MLVRVPFWLWKELKKEAKRMYCSTGTYIRSVLESDIYGDDDEW